MTDGPKNGWAFVIDTDAYAGNFEREMTAYLTGVIGECKVGEELVEELPINFKNSVQQVADEHGCYRPTSCWLEPRSNKYNSVAIFFYERPTKEQISFMKERVDSFNKIWKTKGRMARFNKDPDINILGFRLVEFLSLNNEFSI